MKYTQKHWKPEERIKVAEDLPLTGCYVAPYVITCAIGQDIPEYIHLLGGHRHADALELIYRRNALPAITGHICDHQYQYNCAHLDYNNTLNIRELKRVALEEDWDEHKQRWHKPVGSGSRHPVAVIGTGPVGLAAGYFLARAGHPVALFEREANVSGMVKNIIPQFRIPAELIQHDTDSVVTHDVKFEYGYSPDLTVEQLKNQGFYCVLVTTNTDKDSGVRLAGDNQSVWRSLPFLREYDKDTALKLGKRVVIVGAGNTAMDCARAALYVPGIERATIVYRRSLQEIPAWHKEYEEALHDGMEFRSLNNPECFDIDDTSTLRIMSLGEPDEKGRHRPVEANETVTLHVDSLITAIGEQQDTEAPNAMGVSLDKNGWPDVDHSGETCLTDVFIIGDVQRGPPSIVATVGATHRAADAILSRENIRSHQNSKYWNNVNPTEIYQRKNGIFITLVNSDDRDAFVAQKAVRCLECNYACSKCVNVCSNRANVSIAVPGLQNGSQMLHPDAYCNEYGSCAQFCPWNGKPYKDKITVFNLA